MQALISLETQFCSDIRRHTQVWRQWEASEARIGLERGVGYLRMGQPLSQWRI